MRLWKQSYGYSCSQNPGSVADDQQMVSPAAPAPKRRRPYFVMGGRVAITASMSRAMPLRSTANLKNSSRL